MSAEGSPVAQEWLEEVLPEELDWERIALTYPRITLALAAGAGFWLGLRHGTEILAAVSELAGRTVTKQIDEFLGPEH